MTQDVDCGGGEGVAGSEEVGVACGEEGKGEGEVEGWGEGFEDAAAGLGGDWLGGIVGVEWREGRWGEGELTGMTSRPMPSPGMRPMRRERLAI